MESELKVYDFIKPLFLSRRMKVFYIYESSRFVCFFFCLDIKTDYGIYIFVCQIICHDVCASDINIFLRFIPFEKTEDYNNLIFNR